MEFKEYKGYQYVPKIIERILLSPVGRSVFRDKIGSKYILEGYFKLSRYKFDDVMLKWDGKNTDPDYLSKQYDTLKCMLPCEGDLDEGCESRISSCLPVSKKYLSKILLLEKEPFKIQDHEKMIDDYFTYMLGLIFRVCFDNINPGKEQGQMFLEHFIVEYLNRLTDLRGEPKPKGCISPGLEGYCYNESKTYLVSVASVSEYINILYDISTENSRENSEANEIFYRGQSNSEYLLLPSVFRKFKWRYGEKSMVFELERLCPASFERSKILLDTLVEMQHYNLPTRLLDISGNALAALLFACIGEKSDGEVVLFSNPKQFTCFGQSDKISMFTAMSQMSYQEQRLLNQVSCFFDLLYLNDAKPTVDEFDNRFHEIFKIEQSRVRSESHMSNSKFNRYNTILQIKEARSYLTRTEPGEQECSFDDRDKVLKLFNSLDIVRRLVRQVQKDKPYFEPRIIPGDLSGALFVKASMINPRIVKQSGAFMICGSMPDHIHDVSEILNHYRLKNKGKIPVVLVPEQYKKDILDQLKLCDLHEASIYPEIDKVAGYIKAEHENQTYYDEL